jgi:protein-disulfide isomerase
MLVARIFMSTLYKTTSTLVLVLMFLSWPAGAQEIDENRIKELVQKEVERLLNPEALDAAIERGIRSYIVKQQQAKQQAQNRTQAEKARNLRPVDASRDHILGNPSAPITLIEYSDFECPYCKRFHPTVAELLKNNPDKVRWVYRHFPLGFHNPGAQKQAEASECVAELVGNEAFWQFSDAIYKRTKSNGTGFPLDQLQPLAEEIGVNGYAFAECVSSGRMASRVQQDIDNGASIGISGTPAAFLFNSKNEIRVVVGAQPLAELQRVVDELTNSASTQ